MLHEFTIKVKISVKHCLKQNISKWSKKYIYSEYKK